jgi:HSP20 family protein
MPNIVRFEPFRDLVSVRELMDRLFEESVVSPRGLLNPFTGNGNVPVDIYETDQDVVVKASVPGVKPEDIDVTITGDVLMIKGEFKEETEETEGGCFHCKERRVGSFTRSIALPVAVEADKAEASFENGILKLILPKADAVKPKSIKVKAEEKK